MTQPRHSERLLTFRSGGWVLAVAAVLALGILIWGLAGILVAGGRSAPPRTIDEYGFDLSNPVVPLDLVVPGSEFGVIRTLDSPAMITASEVDAINERERGKYLVEGDRVIGIVVEGEARAYPIRILEWHEVINDVAGARPVAITYNGLCDSAAVFERMIGHEVVEFEVSGLLYNSNLLMYARQKGGGRGGERLWSQLLGRPITGPLGSQDDRLELLPCALVSWGQWRRLHPDTLVVAPPVDGSRQRFYERDAYGSYQSSDALRFPVRPLPPRDGRPFKDKMVAVILPDGSTRASSIVELAQQPRTENGQIEIQVGEATLMAEVLEEPLTVVVRDAAGDMAPVIYTYWFAWHAIREAAER